jgi:hypothetical protein
MAATNKRIVRKNLTCSVAFNEYLIKNSGKRILPNGATVVFSDTRDAAFSAANRLLCNSIVRSGESCYIAEKSGRSWNVDRISPVSR